MDLLSRKARAGRVLAGLLGILVLLAGAQAATLPPAQQNGVNWLTAQVHSDGSLASESASVATPQQAREESQVTLALLAQVPSSLVAAVAQNSDANVEYAARRILAAANVNQADTADVTALLALQNPDGGWGLTANYLSNPLDTAFALEALQAADASATSQVAAALTYFSQAKLADGGWGVTDTSSVYVTANVLLAANGLAGQNANGATVATAAATWLVGARNAAQDYGDTMDDAYALIALSTQSSQSAALAPLATALDNSQLGNGSWADDPYLTALALRGLWTASQTPVTPTTGTVTGIVLDASTNQPLAGASIGLTQYSGIAAASASDGSFTLTSVPVASYTLTVAHAGYTTQPISIQVAAGQTLNVGNVALAPVVTTATLSGVVKSNTGLPLQGVLITASSLSTLTDATGSYQINGIAPGSVKVAASLANYQSASATVTIVANTTYVFSPTLYPVNVTPPPASLQGTVVDATTKAPIVGATVVLGSNTQVTDTNGAFDFTNVTAGGFSLSVNATGYQTVTVTGTAVAGVNSVGAIALQPAVGTTTLQGHVLDSSGHGISNASVIVVEGPSATTDSTGAYQLTGLSGTQFSIQVSASGYVTQTTVLTVTAPGTYTQDFNLVSQQTAQITLGPLTVAPASGGANTDISVSATLVNGGTADFSGALLLEVRDASNNVIGRGVLTDTDNLSIGVVTLPPGGTLGVIGRWNTGQFPAGNYQFELRLVQPGSIIRSNPLGTLIQNQLAAFAITSSSHFSGTVAASPPVIQAGINQSVEITAVVKNDGNIDLPAQPMTLNVVNAQSGAIAFTATANMDALVVNGLANLDFGNWLPAAGGNYQLVVTASDPTLGKISGNAYVGNVAQASFTVTPSTVLAGTRTVHGNIHVTGVNPAQAVVTDPLAPLIKAAIQKAVTYNDTTASQWASSNRCTSCHISNQALVGGELTRQLTSFNAFERNLILNNISSNQAPDGGITQGYYYSGYYHRLGTMTFWGLLSYHNLSEFAAVIKQAADWVVRIQSSNGDWPADYNEAWFNDDTSMAMLNLSNLSKADEFFKTNNISAVTTYTTQPVQANQPVRGRGSLTVTADGNLYYAESSDGSERLVKPDGTLITKWTGFNDPRSVVVRADGQVWLSSTGGTYRLNSDGTSTRLSTQSLGGLIPGPDGLTVWSTVWGSSTLYQLDSTGTATAWLANGPCSYCGYGYADSDGSLYLPDYYSGKIYHILPDKTVSVATVMLQGAGSPPNFWSVLKDGDHWLLSTSNGIYRLSSDWEAQRITWSAAPGQLARYTDGSAIYDGYQQIGIQKLVSGSEPVAPSLPKYENAMSLGTNWLQARAIGSTDTIHLEQQLWGLGESYRFYAATDTVRAASIKTKMTAIATQLRANQNADGGWGNTKGNRSDALVTAQTGIALDYLDPSASDPAIRKAVTWLLSQQQVDGSWVSADGIMSTHVSTTTMVAIWLPTILDRLGAIDAQVSATFPQNVQAASIVPTPDTTSTDASGNMTAVWNLTGVTDTGRDLAFDLTMPDLQPNEVRPTASEAHMTFNNSFNQTAVTVPIAIPDVTAQPPVSLTVVTDQPAYPTNATAQVTTTLNNLDVVPISGDLTVNVYDASGNLIGPVITQQPVTLPPSGSLPVTGPFAIGTIPPVTYTVKAMLSNGSTVLAEGQTTFDVLPNNATGTATSTLHTDRQTYNPSDQVQILSGVQSLSANVTLSNLTLNLSVVDATGAQQFAHSIAIAQLLAGQSLNFTTPQQLANAAPGVYTVKQDLLDASNNLLNHVETTYTVAASSTTGFGLVGTIAATPKSLPVGAPLTLTASATDNGNSALDNLPLTITILDPNGVVMTQFNQTSSIAMGATVPFDTTWVTQGSANTTYRAVLSATVGSGTSAKTLTLATDTFMLTISLKVNVSLTAGTPPLVALVLLDPGANPADATAISTALAAHGYLATFVTTATDFASSVRTGAYQLYLLLANSVMPDTTTQRLLREGVHRGEGVIIANGAGQLTDALAQISGLQSGNLPVINAQAIDVLANAPGGAAHVALDPPLASRIVVPQAAQTQATLTGRLPATPDQGTIAAEVAALGRVDIGYFGSDVGTNGTGLSLTAEGVIQNPDGSTDTVWLIRNSSTTARNVTLASVSGGYSLALTITPQTDTFIASPISADHSLSENGTVIQTTPATTAVFADSRLVDVGANPGAIALWANHINATDVLDWNGAQHVLHGAIHSNSDIVLTGAKNLIDGPVHYVTSLRNSGSQNTFTYLPRPVTVQPLPTLLNLADFAPGGAVATAVGAQYFDETAQCGHGGKWHLTPKDMPLPAGVYYAPCDIQIDGDSPGGNVTLVGTGAIQISGSKGAFTPFYQGVQFASTLAGTAIHLSGSNTSVGGLVFAPNGTVQIDGSSMSFACSIIADSIRLSGAKTLIDARQCAYATVQEQTPAVLFNPFGQGAAVYAAFPWQVAIDQYEAVTPGELTSLFGGALGEIAPNQIVLRTGSIVPLTAQVDNLADPFQGQLVLGVDDDSVFVPPTASWQLSFTPQAESFKANANVRLGSGTSTGVTATVSAASPVVINPLKQASATIAHLAGDTIANLIAATSAIANPDAGLSAALTALNAAQTAQTAGDAQGELEDLLDAAEACGTSTNAQADALRTRIDWVIWNVTH